jgi:hypothetical protein
MKRENEGRNEAICEEMDISLSVIRNLGRRALIVWPY